MTHDSIRRDAAAARHAAIGALRDSQAASGASCQRCKPAIDGPYLADSPTCDADQGYELLDGREVTTGADRRHYRTSGFDTLDLTPAEAESRRRGVTVAMSDGR